MRITTITTDYDENEDRIRLAVADADKNARVLWMTRRLCERMVPALVKGLQTQVAEPNAEPAQVQAAQIYAQLEARLNKKPGRAVAVQLSEAQALVHELKIKTADKGIRVIEFHAKDPAPSVLVMSTPELRQWLEMLRQAFVKGQWREDIWPQWLQVRRPSNT